jgi:hypothetical protein
MSLVLMMKWMSMLEVEWIREMEMQWAFGEMRWALEKDGGREFSPGKEWLTETK